MTPAAQPRCVIVMGVSGSGKSTVGRALASLWNAVFIESDTLHSPSEIEKMARGVPLDDEDRQPWLEVTGERLRGELRQGHRTVAACSALKRAYRDLLRHYVPGAFFVELDGTIDLVAARVALRHHEFMPSSLLESQFAALEPLEGDELGLRVDNTLSVHEIVDAVQEAMTARAPD